jgi:hypothetical protein
METVRVCIFSRPYVVLLHEILQSIMSYMRASLYHRVQVPMLLFEILPPSCYASEYVQNLSCCVEERQHLIV